MSAKVLVVEDDEAMAVALRDGFTYEGSKPGAIVQGLLKMGVMNGMFIFDEADKTEAFAIATLLAPTVVLGLPEYSNRPR